jgi:hypothetical protein
LETYRGALVIDLSSLDWCRWMTAMLDLEAHPHSSIGDIPWGIGYRSEQFGLVSLDDSYVGLRSTSTQFYSIQPHRF